MKEMIKEKCEYCEKPTTYFGFDETRIKVPVCPKCRRYFMGVCNYREWKR